jgi:hypothetical protein
MKQRRKNPYEKGLANHSAPSFAPGIARCSVKRKQGIGGVGYPTPKTVNPDGVKERMKEPYKKGVAIHLASSLALLPRGTQRSVDRG